MHLLLTTLKNTEWLVYFSYPGTAEESDRQESKEQAGESTAMKRLWRKSVDVDVFFITEHHITIHSCG